MIRRFLVLVVVACALGAVAPAQDVREIRRQGDSFIRKVQILEVYNHILPVLMTPEQLKKLLPLVEQARQEERDMAKKEIEMMKGMEAKLDAAIAEAERNGTVPSQEVIRELQQVDIAIARLRQMVIQANVARVYDALKTILNPGQLKAAAGTFTIPRVEGQPELTEEEKVKRWIQFILLEPEAYPILIRLSREE